MSLGADLKREAQTIDICWLHLDACDGQKRELAGQRLFLVSRFSFLLPQRLTFFIALKILSPRLVFTPNPLMKLVAGNKSSEPTRIGFGFGFGFGSSPQRQSGQQFELPSHRVAKVVTRLGSVSSSIEQLVYLAGRAGELSPLPPPPPRSSIQRKQAAGRVLRTLQPTNR